MSYHDLLRHPKWQKKRLEILDRDKFTCQMCHDTETELHVHHLKYSGTGNPWDAKNEDLITYCKVCHLIVEDFKKVPNQMLFGVHKEKFTRIDDMYFIAADLNNGIIKENIIYGINYKDNDYKVAFSITSDNIEKILNMFKNEQTEG